MKKILIDNVLTIVFDSGEIRTVSGDKDFLREILVEDNEETILMKIDPTYTKQKEMYNESKELIDELEESNILVFKGECIYWPEVSELSIPSEFAEAILTAEENEDTVKLESYRNFWTLLSLNPDERCRRNLFWFLKRYGMKIARCGFFVAYRNVVFKEDSPEGPVYTDMHTQTFTIKMGEMVTMPREKCDPCQDHTCSNGLHVAGASWLTRNYCGDVGLVCLVNPCDVVAVPPEDNYGKLRTCAYLPIDLAGFDENDNVVPYSEADGFECAYIPEVIYTGLMGTESDSPYRINIPNSVQIDREKMYNNLLDIARQTIINRVIKFDGEQEDQECES